MAFTQWTFPGYRANWHHAAIAKYATRWARGELKRLMVCVGPQRGKSEVCSRRLPAFALGINPDARVIACSYGASLATAMSRDVQRIMACEQYRELFPSTQLAEKGSGYTRTADEFEIVDRRGSYRSRGVGGGITGKSLEMAILDDPFKSRKEADSPTYRDMVWDWYQNDFYSRRTSDQAGILIINTRWHDDDLSGRLLKQAAENPDLPQWTVVSLPELAEPESHVPEDTRAEGEPLWPSRFPLKDVLQTKKSVGEYVFAALYQQRPSPKEGGLFKLAGLSHHVKESPAVVRTRLRYWDKGYSAGGDFTVGVRMSHGTDGLFYVEDVVRIRESPENRNRVILTTAQADDRKYGKKIPVYIEQPPGAGTETTASLVRLLQGSGVVAHAHRPTGAKEERAEPFAAAVEAGNVRLVIGPWITAFVSELTLFPAGENDDQCDSASSAYNQLTTKQAFRIAVV